MKSVQDIRSLFDRLIGEESLEKAVFSRARDKTVKKAVALPFAGAGGLRYQIQRYTADNKVLHENLAPEETAAALTALSAEEFAQTDLFTTSGQGSFLVSSKGQVHVTVPLSAGVGNAPKVEAAAHNRKKQYLLDPVRHASFLSALGVSDENGRLFDKKRAKFRQINRFLELLDDVYDKLPAGGVLHVCDLCCGKSYLTFAVYYYFTELKGREVSMVGVDLKADVIAYCGALADRLGCKGLRFVSADINRFDSGEPVDMVISLHACDVATDMVLDFAVRKKRASFFLRPAVITK